MSKKGALYQLIKSLTKAEKRYVTISMRSGEGKKYSQLFEFISDQEEMSEEEVKRKFKTASSKQQLHVTKNYLTSFILKNLRSFHENGAVRSRLNGYLTEVQVLHKKELFDHCRDRLNKSRKLAEKYEYFNHLLEVIYWQRKLDNLLINGITRSEKLTHLLGEERIVIDKISNLNNYQQLTHDLLKLDFGAKAEVSEFFKHKLLEGPECAMSYAATTLYYHIIYILKTITGSSEAGKEALLTLIELMEQQPQRIKDSPESYITALNNLMGTSLFSKETDNVISYLQKIRQLPVKYGLKEDKQYLTVLVKTYNVELELYRDTKNWVEGERLIGIVGQFLNDHSDSIPVGYRISLLYQFSYIYFMRLNYSESLRILNVIFNSKFENERIDIQIFARFLQLMVHFELGNTIVLKYAVESFRRYLKKSPIQQDILYERLLRLFSKLSVSITSNYCKVFRKYGAQIFDGIDEQRKVRALDYIDFESWINGKLDRS